jgi:site-specific recombinase XerD
MKLIKVEKDIYGVAAFIANQRALSTRKAYTADISDFFLFLKELGREISSPSSLVISDFINYRDFLSKTKTVATVNRKIASLKSLMKWFHVNGHIDSNPLASLKMPRVSTTKPTEAFTDEEVIRILDACTNLRHKTLLTVLFTLGLRRSELVNLSRADFYVSRGFKIIRIKGKGGTFREIPLPEDLDKLFMEYLDSTTAIDSIFDITPDGVYKIVKKYTHLLGIKNKSPHSCRATAISHLFDNGVPIRDVANFAGHSDINTTLIYDKKRKGVESSPVFKIDYRKTAA